MDLQDRMDIAELYAKYAHRADTGDAEGWADLFAPDASWEMVATPRGPDGWIVTGRAELLQMARDAYAFSEGVGRHWITNILIEGEPPAAQVKCYGFLLKAVDGRMEMLGHGNFVDELVKLDDGWRFKRRTCTELGADRLH